MSDDRIGLVLGGGAALGLAHVGVIRALEEEKIPVDIVVGCSMGALIAGLWATGRSAEDMEKISREFSTRTGMLKLVDLPIEGGIVLLVSGALAWGGHAILAMIVLVVLIIAGGIPGAGMLKGRAIQRWLRNKFGNTTFNEARTSLRMVAYDLGQRRELVLDRGVVAEAVYQSIALPGLLPPVTGPGQMIVDGGVLNPLPVNVLLEMGITRIIAVNVIPMAGQTPPQPGNVRPMAVMPDVIVRSLQVAQDVLAQASGRQAGVLIAPDLGGIEWFELNKSDRAIRAGYEAARKQMPAIKQLIKIGNMFSG